MASETVFVSRENRKRSKALANAVIDRDHSCCQCCYDTEGLEVHHIELLCFGGKDEPENMITLCWYCHKHAPEDPEEFLSYQREGGRIGQTALLKFFNEAEPTDTVLEVWERFRRLLFLRYKKAYHLHHKISS